MGLYVRLGEVLRTCGTPIILRVQGYCNGAGHEINVSGRQTTLIPALEELCQYARDPANGIWIDTVGTIARYTASIRKAGLR